MHQQPPTPWQPRLQSKNPVEFPPWLYELHGRSKCEGHTMGQAAHHYLIFETAGGVWRHRLEQRGHHPLPVANEKRRSDRTKCCCAGRLARNPARPRWRWPRVAVKRYFEGKETDFSMFRLDLGEQDPFFERIYAAARRVGWGRTTTYGALAKELGAGPEAARDVGQAMAKNPVALMIPCHRVLAAGGKVGGFSAPDGSAAKIRMLALEGVQVEAARPAQQSFGF